MGVTQRLKEFRAYSAKMYVLTQPPPYGALRAPKGGARLRFQAFGLIKTLKNLFMMNLSGRRPDSAQAPSLG